MATTQDPVLIEMREAAAEYGSSVSIEKIIFGPAKHAIRIKQGRKNIGPLLFPAEGQTIGQCLDEFLEIESEKSDG
jgi:hypothetical protein